MTQNEHFQIGTTEYPLQTGSGNSILYDGDNVTYRLLEFYSNILQLNLGARWTNDAAYAGLTNANFPNIRDGYIVGDAIAYPPDQTLMATKYTFPLLAIWRTKERNVQFTTFKILLESEYVIHFVLPPLSTPQMYNALYPYLESVTRTISFYNFAGSDPKFNNGELVFKEANIDFAYTEGSEYGSFLIPETNTKYPSIRMRMKTYEQNHFIPQDYINLQGFDGYISNINADGYGPIDIADITQNVSFFISSISQTSGPTAGGQLIVITGSGFNSLYPNGDVATSQITVAGQVVQSVTLKSDNLIMIYTGAVLTAPTPSPIVLTDWQGNTTASQENYTYE